MRLLIFDCSVGIILCAVFLSVVKAEGDYLPFLLSNATCNIPKHFTPMCICTNRLQINDFRGLCGSHKELVDCLEGENSVDPTSLIGTVFNKTLALKRLQYLCGMYTEVRSQLESCSYQSHSRACDGRFIPLLSQVNVAFNKPMTCGFSYGYSECYWNTSCPANVKLFLSSMVDFYSTSTCAKHGMAISEKCNRQAEAQFPDNRKNRHQCINLVHAMKECFHREQIRESQHPVDVLHNIEFDIDNYEQYRIFRCDIEHERDHNCNARKRKQQKECFQKYSTDINEQIARIHNGTFVTSADICRIYDVVTQCMTDVFTKCPVESVYFNSILCASMPSSCNCPVDLAQERIARSSGASRTTKSVLILIVHLAISVIIGTVM